LYKLSKLSEFIDLKHVITVLTLTAICAISLYLRLIPVVKWGYYLNEFDPFMRYYVAEQIERRGFSWWFSWWFEHDKILDTKFWYPYGIDIRKSFVPGVSLMGVVLHRLLGPLLGLTLKEVAVITPAVMSIFTVIGAYLLGQAICGRFGGLLTALLVTFCPAYVSRSVAGWFDDEAIAMPFIVWGLYLFVQALKEERRSWTLLLSLLSGLCFGFVAWTWGAYLYLWNLLALYVIVAILLRVGKVDKVVLTYLLCNTVFTAMIVSMPRYGITALRSLTAALPNIATVLSLLYIVLTKFRVEVSFEKLYKRIVYVLPLLIVVLTALLIVGILVLPAGRILAVVIPKERSPLVESVGEHKVSTWYNIFSDLGYLIPFAIVAIPLMIYRGVDEVTLLVILYAITSLYSAASMVRLTVLMTPIWPLLAVYTLREFFILFVQKTREQVRYSRKLKKMYGFPREYAIGVLLLMVIVFTAAVCYSVNNAMRLADAPALILSSSLAGSPRYKMEYADWLSALEWMRNNLPQNAVIASWWDYGYWISVVANRTSLADNSTINGTQIRRIALAFISDEETAVKIFKELGAQYVVVFEPAIDIVPAGIIKMPHPYAGDFAKSYWMARIAGLSDEEVRRKYLATATLRIGETILRILVPANTTEARNATLYKLIFGAKPPGTSFIWIFEPMAPVGAYYQGPRVVVEQPKYFKLVYVSAPNGWVKVFRIEYPKS